MRTPLTRAHFLNPIIFITGTEYYSMPPIYNFHNYDECMEKYSGEALYCVVDTILQPNLSSNIWKTILKYNDTKRHFRHDHLQYGLCFQECNKSLARYARFYLEDNFYTGKFRDGDMVSFGR